LFLFSGSAKLGLLEVFRNVGLDVVANTGIDPAHFGATIKAFAILHTDLIPFVAFTLPWFEVICGMALIVGVFPRGAATILNFLLIAFCAAMITVMIRKIDVECTCFGKFLGGKVGWMSLGRNAIFLAILLPVAKWGGGNYALGSALCRCKSDHNGSA
jgi:hypothetical protein